MPFILKQKKNIPALQIEMEWYEHIGTGAEHLHLKSDNIENVFLVALRTVPTDSTGVPHILEHLALCGSEHYPVRDPFFMMHRRSLNTFMNAFTSADWTAYPFASQNKKDFNNLRSVYLDAVFFPLLDKLDFAQEGHRLEFENPDNAETPLTYKGVVFNEMKGALSAPMEFLSDLLSKHLYEKTTYHFNSGGDPACIPSLTHDQLHAFYQKHYHPTNSILMTFGNIPASDHQACFEEKVLAHFTKSETLITIDNEPRFSQKKIILEKYPVTALSPHGKQTYIALTWLLPENKNYEDLLAAELLSTLLLDNSACPLLQALETTPLASAPLAISGLQTECKQMSFTCGVEGSEAIHADEIETLVCSVFEAIEKNGFPADKVEAALHQLELSQREISGGSYPYGLQLILGCLPALIHRRDPMSILDLDHALSALRKKCADPNFLKKLVRELFLDNPHHVRLTVIPDTKFASRKIREEKKVLNHIKNHLTPVEKEILIQQATALKERQEKEEDLSILPNLLISDIPANIPNPQPAARLPHITSYQAGTNGLIYQDLIIECPQLSTPLLSALPYFTSCLTELGHGTHDYLAAQSRQAEISGGLYSTSIVKMLPATEKAAKAYFTLRTKALAKNHRAASQLIKDSFIQARFDEHQRIQELIAQIKADCQKSLVQNGHQLAMIAAASACDPLAYYQHHQSGLQGIKNTYALHERLQAKGAKALSEQFQAIHSLLMQSPKQFLLVGEAAALSHGQNDIKETWGSDLNPVVTTDLFSISENTTQTHQCWIIETEVNFCAKAFPTVRIEHPDAPALMVLAAFMRQGFLHRMIREQGGAYGGGASYDAATKSFRFYSYRDPRLQETLDDFERSIDWMCTEHHNPEKLDEAIFDVIGRLDKPSSPAGDVQHAFYNTLYSRTYEDFLKYRQAVILTTLEDLKRVAIKYLQRGRGHTAVITNHQGKCKETMEVIQLQ